MYKIAVMGDKDSVYGFAALGLAVYPCDNAAEGEKILKNLVKTEFGVIYMTEKLYTEMADCLEVFRSQPLPAIIPIPGVVGNTGIGMRDVSRSVEKAVGSDIVN